MLLLVNSFILILQFFGPFLGRGFSGDHTITVLRLAAFPQAAIPTSVLLNSVHPSHPVKV
jgi:hypothetical protein